MIKWFDSRLKKPNCTFACIYPVVFLYQGCVFDGYATWKPKNNYTDGEWSDTMCTNSNNLNGLVLYWKSIPERPEGIDL